MYFLTGGFLFDVYPNKKPGDEHPPVAGTAGRS
jgi:hypothetical protein